MVALKRVRETTSICSLVLLLDLIWKTDGSAGVQQQQQQQQQQRRQSNHKSNQLHKITDQQRANEATAPSSDCLPVPQDILWRKLVSDSSPFIRGRSSLTPSAAAMAKRRLRHQKKPRNKKNVTRKANAAAGLERRRKSNGGQAAHQNTVVDSSKAHECKFEMRWKRMPDGVFPQFIESGKCSRKPCMMGFSLCTPRKYAITILKRVPSECRPLVTTTTNRTSVEVWRSVEHFVTVGCSCAKRKRAGVFPSTFATDLSKTTI